ncbi:hypothetical protein BH11PLA1_BH11PLA1_07380 [soil metagenome]
MRANFLSARSPVLSALILLAAVGGARADSFYDIFYNVRTFQTPGTPLPMQVGYDAIARYVAETTADAESASVTFPSGTVYPLERSGLTFLKQSILYGNDSTLIFNWPDGVYTFAISGGTLGTQSATLNRAPGALWTPHLPRVNNLDQLQLINPTMEFQVQVDGFDPVAGAAFNLVFVELRDAMGLPVFEFSGPSSTTSVPVAPNTLAPSQTFGGTVWYSARNTVGNAGLSGASATVGWDRVVDFSITTGTGNEPINRCQPADIACDDGQALNPGDTCPNNGVNEGDYNCFFNTFFTNQALGSPADIAADSGTALPPFGSGGVNNGVNEGDYNCFFNNFFNGC